MTTTNTAGPPSTTAQASLYQHLRSHLAVLKLHDAAEHLPAVLDAAVAEGLSMTAALERLLAVEVDATEARRLAGRLRFASLPTPATLDGFDYDAAPGVDRALIAELATCRYLETATNVLLIGPPGTGKTHLAVGLVRAAAQAGYRTYFTPVRGRPACHRAGDHHRRAAGPARRLRPRPGGGARRVLGRRVRHSRRQPGGLLPRAPGDRARHGRGSGAGDNKTLSRRVAALLRDRRAAWPTLWTSRSTSFPVRALALAAAVAWRSRSRTPRRPPPAGYRSPASQTSSRTCRGARRNPHPSLPPRRHSRTTHHATRDPFARIPKELPSPFLTRARELAPSVLGPWIRPRATEAHPAVWAEEESRQGVVLTVRMPCPAARGWHLQARSYDGELTASWGDEMYFDCVSHGQPDVFTLSAPTADGEPAADAALRWRRNNSPDLCGRSSGTGGAQSLGPADFERSASCSATPRPC